MVGSGVSGRRSVLFAVTASLLLLPAGNGLAEVGEPGEASAVPASLTAASWAEATIAGAGYNVPLDVVSLSPGGAAVWGGQVSGSRPISSVGLVLRGLPADVNVKSVQAPTFVPRGQRLAPGKCRTSLESATVVCDGLGSVDPGRVGFAALSFSVPGDASASESKVSVTLTDGDAELGAVSEFSLKIQRRTPERLAVESLGDKITQGGKNIRRTIHVYNLGGSASAGSSALLRLSGLMPRGARPVRASGRGWSCARDGSHCAWRGKFEPGQSADPLDVRFQATRAALTGLRKQGGAFALAWHAEVRRPGRTHQGLAQLVHVVPNVKPSEPKPVKVPRGMFGGSRHLDVRVDAIGQQRLGGQARYRVSIFNGGGLSVPRAVMRIRTPSHARLTRFLSHRDWQCDPAGVCIARRAIQSHHAAPVVEFSVASKAPRVSAATAAQKVHVRLSWRDRGRWASSGDAADGVWEPLLGVSASAMTGKLTADGVRGRGILEARIRGLGKAKSYSYSWSQVCQRPRAKCPKVRWSGPRQGTSSQPRLTANFTAPRLLTSAKAYFNVTIMSGGGVATDRAIVEFKPWRKQRPIDPRMKESRPDFATLNNPRNWSALGTARAIPGARVRIGRVGPETVASGSRLSVAARISGLRSGFGVRRVEWLLDGGPAWKVPTASVGNRGMTLSFHVPKHRSAPYLLTAVVKHLNGRVTHVQDLVIVRQGHPAVRQSAGAAGGPGVFCALYANAQTMTPGFNVNIGPVSLAVDGVSTAGGKCTDSDAAILFTNATTNINSVGLSGLQGKITPTGLAISAGAFTLAGGRQMTFRDTSLVATYSGDGFGFLSGSVAVASMPYIPLPGGWQLDSSRSTLSFSVNTTGGQPAYRAALGLVAGGGVGKEGSVVLQGEVNPDGSVLFSVAASNVWTLTGTGGDTATFGGSGTIRRTAAGEILYQVALEMVASPNFALFSNLTLSDASITWDNSGLSVVAHGTVPVLDDWYALTATGTVTGLADWSLSVVADKVPSYKSVQIDDLAGLVYMKNGGLGLSLSATLKVFDKWNLPQAGITLDKLPVIHLANAAACWPKVTSTCDLAAVALAVDLAGTLDVFGVKVPLDASVAVSLKTGELDGSLGLFDQTIGPAGYPLKDAEFFFAQDPSQDPILKDSPCLTTEVAHRPTVGAAGTVQVGGANYQAVIMYSMSSLSDPNMGFCISGEAKETQLGTNYSLTGVTFVYSTDPISVTAPGGTRYGPVPANSAALVGWLNLPDDMANRLGLRGVDVIATYQSGGNFFIEVDAVLSPIYLTGSADPDVSSLSLTGVGMKGQIGPDDSFSLVFRGNVHYPANEAGTVAGKAGEALTDQGIAATDMPLIVTVGITSGGLLLDAQLGDGVTSIENAFGVPGFTIRELEIGGVIGVTPAIHGVSSMSLPNEISSKLGLTSGTIITAAFDLSATKQCVALQIMPGEGQTVAGQWGPFELNSAQIVVAPEPNCQLGGVSYSYNFSLAIDSHLFGVEVAFALGMTPGNKATGKGFSVIGYATIGAFSLGGVKIEETQFYISDSFTGFVLQFQGGMKLWNSVNVDLSGDFEEGSITHGGNWETKLVGDVDLDLAGVIKADGKLNFETDYNIVDHQMGKVDIDVSASVDIWVVKAGVALDFDYSDGVVQTLDGEVDLALDVYFGHVSGTLRLGYDRTQDSRNGYIEIKGTAGLNLGFWKPEKDFDHVWKTDFGFDGGSSTPDPPWYITNPVNTTPNTWEYSSEMFMGINDWAPEGSVEKEAGLTDFDPSRWSQWGSRAVGYARGVGTDDASKLNVIPNSTSTVLGGDGDDPTKTYTKINVTVTLPVSPVAVMLNRNLFFARGTYSSTCTGPQAKTFDVVVPFAGGKYLDAAQWSWVMMETNWRVYLATVRERNMLMNNFPTVTSGPNVNGGWAPVVPIGTQAAKPGTVVDCGYDSWDAFPSLYDFEMRYRQVGASDIQVNTCFPTNQSAPPAGKLDDNPPPICATSEYGINYPWLQPGWGSTGWYRPLMPPQPVDYEYRGADVPLTPGRTAVASVEVPAGRQPVSSVRVSIDELRTAYPYWTGIYLNSPAGTRVSLTDGKLPEPKSGGSDFLNTVLTVVSDPTVGFLVNAQPPYTGTFYPIDPFASLDKFNDEDPTGTWWLEVSEPAQVPNPGTLKRWSVRIT